MIQYHPQTTATVRPRPDALPSGSKKPPPTGSPTQEFLELILQDELNVRQQRQIDAPHQRGRVPRAQDRSTTLTGGSIPSISRKQIYELAAGHFIRPRHDVLFVGPPGVGKTHLAQAIGYEAIKQGRLVNYRSIFDLVRDFLADEALKQRDRVLSNTSSPTC